MPGSLTDLAEGPRQPDHCNGSADHTDANEHCPAKIGGFAAKTDVFKERDEGGRRRDLKGKDYSDDDGKQTQTADGQPSLER